MNYIHINNEFVPFYIEKLNKTPKGYVYDSIYISKYIRFKFSCEECGAISERGMNLRSLDFICRKCKTKHTSQAKYGTDSPNQSTEVQNKKIQSNINNFGKVFLNSKEFKDKSDQTKTKRYGNKNYNNIEKRGNTKLEKYGDKNYTNTEKRDNTILNKYGVKNISQSEEIKYQKKQTSIKRYGETSYMKTEDGRRKISENYPKYNIKSINRKREQTNLIRFGYKNPNQSPDVISKRIFNTRYARYIQAVSKVLEISPLFNENEYNGIHYSNKYSWECNICGCKFEDDLYAGKIPKCPHCHPKTSGISKTEKELFSWITTLEIEIVENDRTILNGKELDVYMPSHNLAMEFDGLYWHSELQGKDSKYHLNKTLECQDKGICLVHIFEDEWLEKQNIVKSIIKSKLELYEVKLGARKCEIKMITSAKATVFYDMNHLQGGIKSSINIGLFYQNELVSCLSFSRPRFNKKYDWEITRFANKLNWQIMGSFSKLFKHFLSNYTGSVITYSDRRWFNGDIYRNNGFNELEPSKPAYWYIKNQNRLSRIQFQKHKLSKRLEQFDPALTEWENMQLNGYDRIWDCGNYVFELIR